MLDDPPSPTRNRELAIRIIAAYVRRNQVDAAQMPSLIAIVHDTLADLGRPQPDATESIPAVSIRRSVQHDSVTCIECGWAGSMLRRHIGTAHGLTLDQYRARWSLPHDHAMVAPAYSERRSTMAKQLGLGRGRGGRGASGTVPEVAAPDAPAAAQSRRRGRPRSTATPA